MNDNIYTMGTQVVYVPSYISKKFVLDKLNLNDPQDEIYKTIQLGFVTEDRDDIVFCRFFSNINKDELRTTSCSEGCDRDNLMLYNHHSQKDINQFLKEYYNVEN